MIQWVLWMGMMRLSDLQATDLHGCTVGSPITVSKAGKVSISCPSSNVDTTELTYQLFFNSNKINEMHLQKFRGADSSFSDLFEVTAHSSGEYRCRRESLYPPPSRERCHATVVVVGENRILPTTNQSVSLSNQTCIQSSLTSSRLIPELALWVACGIVLVYSLSVTCIAICIWRKQRREEEDSNEYVNSRPCKSRKPCKTGKTRGQ
ncbi:uncharacterized protein LOC143003949 [Genypterus blacodes]|uniref:uncharacterized protein LOC143003949 n=1 Tax=Genypterus blacodes TaxID=154954 RepID=UPI003F7758CB